MQAVKVGGNPTPSFTHASTRKGHGVTYMVQPIAQISASPTSDVFVHIPIQLKTIRAAWYMRILSTGNSWAGDIVTLELGNIAASISLNCETASVVQVALVQVWF